MESFDRLRDLTASHKAAVVIRGAAGITWDVDVSTLQALSIRPALRLADKKNELINALYRFEVGILRAPGDALTRVIVTTSDGTHVATVDLPAGFRLA